MTLGTHTYQDMCTYHKPLLTFGDDEIEIFRNGNNPTWYSDNCTRYHINPLLLKDRGYCKTSHKQNPFPHSRKFHRQGRICLPFTNFGPLAPFSIVFYTREKMMSIKYM